MYIYTHVFSGFIHPPAPFKGHFHRSRRCGAAARRFDVLSDGGRAADAERRAAALRGDAHERRDGGRLIDIHGP